jgi:hypothetical protein
MPFPFESGLSPFCVKVLMVAGDASKQLKAAPGVGKALVITKWSYRSTTSAAQAITLADGTSNLDVLEASIAVGTLKEGPKLEMGVALATNAALTATPAAAGPAGIFIVEGYVKNA